MADELDFDELHSAVNELMSQRGKRRAPKAAAEAPQPVVAPTPAAVETPKPAPKPADDGLVKITVKRPTPTLSVPPRQRGSAMDIISAPAPVAPPSARANRTAPTLKPTQDVEPEKPQPTTTPHRVPAAMEPDDDVLSSLNMQDESDVPSGAPKPKESDKSKDVDVWPDPLDYHGFKEDGQENTIPAPKELPQEKEIAATHDPLLDESDEPETPPSPAEPAPTMTAERPEGSPFIDTKVEKRPLGAYAASPKEDPAPAPAPEPASTPKAADKTAAPAPDVAALSPQPKELSPEVVAVESADADNTPADGGDVNAVRQMAITPQYKTHDKEPSQAERPVFDTKEYHPPIDPSTAHKPASKHGSVGLLIMLAILVLVALGIGILWMTGMLDLSKYI